MMVFNRNLLFQGVFLCSGVLMLVSGRVILSPRNWREFQACCFNFPSGSSCTSNRKRNKQLHNSPKHHHSLMMFDAMKLHVKLHNDSPHPHTKKISSGEGVPSAASFQRDTSRSAPWRWARRTRTAFRRQPSQPKSCVPGNAKPELFVGFPGMRSV